MAILTVGTGQASKSLDPPETNHEDPLKGLLYLTKSNYKQLFPVSRLYWALQLECESLLFMWYFGPLK